MSNFYKGIDNVTIHAIELDIVLTQDIICDYIKTGKISPCCILIIEQPQIGKSRFLWASFLM